MQCLRVSLMIAYDLRIEMRTIRGVQGRKKDQGGSR